MSAIAALRWLTRGPDKPPVIQYMLLDAELEYLIYPREVLVYHLAQDLEKILSHIERLAKNDFIIHYKSITKHFGMHRRDSEIFHNLLNHYLQTKKIMHANCRTASLLKKTDLKLFKNALFMLDVDTISRGNAFIAHLWAIALKATPSRVQPVIKTIWKSRYHIKKMNKQQAIQFSEFLTSSFLNPERHVAH